MGYIRVLQVEAVAIDDLTDADARPDGFETAAQLRDELRALYGDKLAAGYQAYRIVFRLAPEEAKKAGKTIPSAPQARI